MAGGSRNSAPLLLPITFLASTLSGSATTTGTVTLDAPAPPGGATVVMMSGNTAALTVPTTVVIAAGQSSLAYWELDIWITVAFYYH